MKLVQGSNYFIQSYQQSFLGKFISERANYYIFYDHISKEDISVPKKDIKINSFDSLDINDIYSVSTHNILAIFSKLELIKFYQKYPKDAVLISVYTPDSKPLNLNYFSQELYIDFWDLEEDFGSYKTLSNEKAKKIYDFIIENRDKKFIINCDAGISRSAGIGLAVECLIDYNGSKYDYAISNSAIKDFPRYSPNLTVFDKIISFGS